MMEELDYWDIENKANSFHRSKIGRLYLKVCHYFGYKLDIWQPEELTLRLPTHYSDTDHYIFENTPDWILKDVIQQISVMIQTNQELEFRCRHTGYIRAYWQENDWTSSKVFCYQEGLIFDNKEVFIRNSKINKILE